MNWFTSQQQTVVGQLQACPTFERCFGEKNMTITVGYCLRYSPNVMHAQELLLHPQAGYFLRLLAGHLHLDPTSRKNFFAVSRLAVRFIKLLQLLAFHFSTSCSFFRLHFQLLAFRKFLQANSKNTTFFPLMAACVFLRHNNFLRHFLRIHYF